MNSLNPYEPPAADGFASPAISPDLLTAYRIYWWVGSVGVLFCCCAALIGIFALGGDGLAPVTPIALTACLHACFFNYCRVTGNRLYSRPEQSRFRSRNCRLCTRRARLPNSYFSRPILCVEAG